MTSSPNSLLKSFDPFITHSFTNGSGLTPRSPLPPSYPAPLPSPYVRAYHPKKFSSELSDSSSVASTDSNSSSQHSTPMHSPKPLAPSMVSLPPRQIFEKFRKDATTPELVLKKRLHVQSTVVSRPK